MVKSRGIKSLLGRINPTQESADEPEPFPKRKATVGFPCPDTCSGRVCVVRLFGQVEDLFARVRGRDCVLPLPCFHRIILLPIIVSIIELLKPLNEIQVVLETPFHQLLHWDHLQYKIAVSDDPVCIYHNQGAPYNCFVHVHNYGLLVSPQLLG